MNDLSMYVIKTQIFLVEYEVPLEVPYVEVSRNSRITMLVIGITELE